MTPGEGEDSPTFVLRVEATRKSIGIAATGLEHVFMTRLAREFRWELE